MDHIQKNKWEMSYGRQENWILAPKEQVIKFLSRFIRKKINANQFEDIIDLSDNINALDLGCGIGRQSLLLKEFGLNPTGIDISKQAIKMAKILAKNASCPELANNFLVGSESTDLPFTNNYFKVSISECALDSMRFDLAKSYVKELDRVTDGYFYCSLISGDRLDDGKPFDGELIVQDSFEQGTIQSYFTESKITSLFADTRFDIIWSSLVREDFLHSHQFNDRYYIVAKN